MQTQLNGRPIAARVTLPKSVSADLFYCFVRGMGANYSDQHVCMSVCLSIRSHISKTTPTNFTQFSAHVIRSRGSVLVGSVISPEYLHFLNIALIISSAPDPSPNNNSTGPISNRTNPKTKLIQVK